MKLSPGLRFSFAPSSAFLRAAIRTIDAERHCCPFLEFQLTVEPGNGPIWLTMSGPAGTREFLAALLDGGAVAARVAVG